jgi:molybdopterin molybdotransferase
MTLEQVSAKIFQIVGHRVLEPETPETVVLTRTHGRVLARPVVLSSAQGPIAAHDEAGLQAGTVLTPLRIARLARCGIATVQATRRPTVAVFTIGEALEPGLPVQDGQRYDGARDLLVGLLRADGFEPTAWPRLSTEPRQVEIALRDAGCAFDSIFVCGTGDALLLVRAVLESFGTLDAVGPTAAGESCAVFGTLDTACVLALPAEHTRLCSGYLTLGRCMLDGLHGRYEPRPVWRGRLANEPAGTLFQLVRVEFDRDGVLAVHPLAADDAAINAPGQDADALLVLPETGSRPRAGEPVDVIPLPLP